MKKRILIICIVIVVLAVGIYFLFINKKDTNSQEVSNTQNTEYYGKRGNITETERVSFLLKAEDLLIGMMALEPKTEETEFSETDMIKFAIYVAQERYGSMLEQRKNRSGEYEYYIDTEVIDDIINEFFGKTDLTYSYESEEYNYSRSNQCFISNVDLEKTLWYYPVSQETTDDRIVITVDSVYIDDSQEDYSLREAKYEGKYQEDKVDSTIKFNYDKNGYLVSYQYVE